LEVIVLKITQECDYAIRIVLMLAKLGSGKRVDAASIAETQSIPQRFTVKILRKLVQSGLVTSFKGAKGGYQLGKKAETITLKDVMWVIDGPVEINKCVNEEYICGRTEKQDCPVHCQLIHINDMIDKELEKIDFAYLAEQEKDSE